MGAEKIFRWTGLRVLCAALGAFVLLVVGVTSISVWIDSWGADERAESARVKWVKRERVMRERAIKEMLGEPAAPVAPGDMVFVTASVPGFNDRWRVYKYWRRKKEGLMDAEFFFRACAECGSAEELNVVDEYRVVEVQPPCVRVRKEGGEEAWWTATCWVGRTDDIDVKDVVHVGKMVPGFDTPGKVDAYMNKGDEADAWWYECKKWGSAVSLYSSRFYRVEEMQGDYVCVRELNAGRRCWTAKRWLRCYH